MSSGMLGLHAAKLLKQIVVTKMTKITNTAFSKKYLFFTNTSISFTLSGLGDVLEQRYEIIKGDLKEWDSERTRKMAISGIAVGILCHYYYAILDRTLPGRSLRILVKKVVIDQVICSPICIGAFLITVGYLEGLTINEFVEDMKQKGWRLYKADWVVWPPAQVINFYFLPPRFRVLYDSTISLGYDVYTSYVNHDNNNNKCSKDLES